MLDILQALFVLFALDFSMYAIRSTYAPFRVDRSAYNGKSPAGKVSPCGFVSF